MILTSNLLQSHAQSGEGKIFVVGIEHLMEYENHDQEAGTSGVGVSGTSAIGSGVYKADAKTVDGNRAKDDLLHYWDSLRE